MALELEAYRHNATKTCQAPTRIGHLPCAAWLQLATASGNVVFFDQHGVPFAVPAASPMIQAMPDPRDGTWHYTIAASVAERQVAT